MDLADIGDIAGLGTWQVLEGGLAAASVRLIAHPRFARAAKVLAGNMLRYGEAENPLEGIFKDAGRYVSAMLIFYLSITGELTLPRLKAFCAASGYLSPGRARALLLYMQHLHCIEMVQPAGRGVPATYALTATFVDFWRDHLSAALDAARVVEPSAEAVQRLIETREGLDLFARHHIESLMTATQEASLNEAHARVFMHRHAGNQVVALLAAGGEAGEFPPTTPTPVSLAATARRFNVSRIHLKRMLDEAEREGLIRLPADGAVVLTEPFRGFLQSFYAMQLVELLSAAARAVGEVFAGDRQAAVA